MQDADDWIRDLNYSEDGTRLAVASNDCKIYVYATRDGFAKLCTISTHQSFVTQVDFSTDGNYIQSADGARSLLFADAATGMLIPSEQFISAARFLSYRLQSKTNLSSGFHLGFVLSL